MSDPIRSVFGVPISETPHDILCAAEIAQAAGKKSSSLQSKLPQNPEYAQNPKESSKTSNTYQEVDLEKLGGLIKQLVAAEQKELGNKLLDEITEFVDNQLSDIIEDRSKLCFDMTLSKARKSFVEMKEEVQEELKKMRGLQQIQVVTGSGKSKKTVDLGLVHKQFQTLLKTSAATTANGRLNIWLAGPAGSGKTTAAMQVAKALGLDFQMNGAIDNPYSLLGFIDAQGRIVSRPFRQAYENGGVYLFDEIDASLPSALMAFNAATANGYCDFPDKLVKRHKDCIVMAGANTHGQGASAHYIGRNKQDGAFLDRFVMINWETDETLEMNTAPNESWTLLVQAVRKYILANGIQAIVSPRASYFGASLLEQGLDIKEVVSMTIRKGIPQTVWNQISAEVFTPELLKRLEETIK